MTHSTKDHALAAIKAGLNLIPVVGDALASLIGDYVPTSTQAAIEQTTGLLSENWMCSETALILGQRTKRIFPSYLNRATSSLCAAIARKSYKLPPRYLQTYSCALVIRRSHHMRSWTT